VTGVSEMLLLLEGAREPAYEVSCGVGLCARIVAGQSGRHGRSSLFSFFEVVDAQTKSAQ